MTFPSATLLAQSALSGVFIGSLYGLLGLGLGLTWGLLHIINLAHFAFAFLAAYLCYQLASVGGMDPLADARDHRAAVLRARRRGPMAARAFLGVAAQFAARDVRPRRRSSKPASSGVWTADFRKLESVYAGQKFRVGELFVPVPELHDAAR